jgi:hypothetical protein
VFVRGIGEFHPFWKQNGFLPQRHRGTERWRICRKKNGSRDRAEWVGTGGGTPPALAGEDAHATSGMVHGA